MCPAGGKLDMHLDYSIHPHSNKERRVNLINYLCPGWDPAWGGSLQLYGHDDSNQMTELIRQVDPAHNRACLFRTSDISFHGFPDAIVCPPDHARKSLAVYYVAPARAEAAHRYKARYYARPTDPPHEGLVSRKDVGNWIGRDG